MDGIIILKFLMLGILTIAFAWFFYKNHEIDKKYADKASKH